MDSAFKDGHTIVQSDTSPGHRTLYRSSWTLLHPSNPSLSTEFLSMIIGTIGKIYSNDTHDESNKLESK